MKTAHYYIGDCLLINEVGLVSLSFGVEYILKVVILFAGFTICIAAFWKTLY